MRGRSRDTFASDSNTAGAPPRELQELAAAQQLLARHMADVADAGSRGSSQRSSSTAGDRGGLGGYGSGGGSGGGGGESRTPRAEPLLSQVEVLVNEHRLALLEQERLRGQLGAAGEALAQARVKEDRLSALEQQRCGRCLISLGW
jgi:hypothetical protein